LMFIHFSVYCNVIWYTVKRFASFRVSRTHAVICTLYTLRRFKVNARIKSYITVEYHKIVSMIDKPNYIRYFYNDNRIKLYSKIFLVYYIYGTMWYYIILHIMNIWRNLNPKGKLSNLRNSLSLKVIDT